MHWEIINLKCLPPRDTFSIVRANQLFTSGATLLGRLLKITDEDRIKSNISRTFSYIRFNLKISMQLNH